MNRTAWIAALIVVSVPLVGCVNREAQKTAKKTQEFLNDKTTRVTTQTPVIKEIAEELEITGSMTSSEDSPIGAQASGRVVAMYVKDGDQVVSGQVIAKLESTDLNARVRQAQAQLRTAQAAYAAAKSDSRTGPDRTSAAVKSAEARLASSRSNLQKLRKGDRPEQRRMVAAQVAAAKSGLDVAKKDLDRFRALYKDGAVSLQDVDRQENAYRQSLAQYEQALENQRMQQQGPREEDIRAAENDVRAAEQAVADVKANKRNDVQFDYRVEQAASNVQAAQEALIIAQSAVEEAVIRAPFSGRVSGKPLALGTFAGPGTPIARIVGTDGTYLEGDVPESRLSGVQEGARVEVRLDALKGVVFNGTVQAINPQGSETSRLFKVRVQLDGGDNRVKAGMFARARVQTRVVPDAMVVPLTAVQGAADESYVMVADGDKAKKVKVAVGVQRGTEIQISGIDPSSEVIIDGQVGLLDGAKIKVVKA